MVKRQQRQSYVVQAQKLWSNCTSFKVNSATKTTCWLLLSLSKIIIPRKEPSFVHAGFTNMNGATYEFFRVLLGQSLMETAPSLDQRINPTIYFIQND
jgi:hypothetical protein